MIYDKLMFFKLTDD